MCKEAAVAEVKTLSQNLSERLKKTMRTWIRMAGLRADISARDFPNTK
jgi:hypothetical protein